MKITALAIRIALVVELAAALTIGSARAAAADVASSNDQPILQEVIVTATKRAENVQDVPSAVSVESGDDLVRQGLTSLAQYAANIPGFNVVSDGTPGQTSVSIRGISSNTATSAVGVYMDDTPIGSSSGWASGSTTLMDMLPYDLERIEVLRGPQGTLYGAGSMGGLISYVLRPASTTQFQAQVGSDLIGIDGAGKLGDSVRGRVNLPVIDQVLGVSLSGFEQTTPGYMTNLFPGAGARDTNQDRQYGGRLAVLWQPMTNLSVKLSALTEVIEADDSAFRQSGATPVPNVSGALLLAPANPLPDRTESVAFLAPFDQHVYYTSATVDWNTELFDVISATSYSKQSSFLGGDITPQYGSILPYVGGTTPGLADIVNIFGLRKFTQELRLVSPKDQPLEWLVGVFGTHERSFNTYWNEAFTPNYQVYPSFPFPPGLFYSTYPETYNEYAAYGDLTWNVTKAFSITVGARYAYNDQRILFDTQGALIPPSWSQYVGITSHQGVPTWLGTATYHFTPDTMVYARVATGYRPGGPNSPIPDIPVTYKSDSLINYELGLKSTFLDHRAMVDLSIYRIDWKNIQLTAATSQDVLYEANGGSAISQGVELQSSYSPIEGLILGLNAAYTDARLESVFAESSFLLTGYQLPQVPKESVSVNVDYTFPLMNDWTAHTGATYRYLGRQYAALVESASPISSPTFETPGYSVSDLYGSVQNNHLTFKFYVHNLANSRAMLAGGSTQGSVVINGATGAETILASFLQPRTVGAGFDYAF